MKPLYTLLFFTFLAQGQTGGQAGVQAGWDVNQTLDALSAQANRLKPILAQLTPQQWISKGAPDTYVKQWKSSQDELGYLVDTAKNLEKQPERLTIALETYFRMQSLEMQLRSLADGVRTYQNPAVGDLLIGVLAENSSNRDKLRQYITDLALTKEQEFKVVDQEAQRCRGVLSHQPSKPAPAKKNQ